MAIADLDARALATAGTELSALTEVQTHQLDVTDRAAYAAVAAEVERGLGPVSLLFNNAGIADSTPVSEMSRSVYEWMRGVNIDGVFNGLERFVPGMIARGEGHVVNTSSEQGLAPGASGFLYSMTKFALIGMSEGLRKELAPLGVGVSVLCPGPVATGIIENTRSLRPEGASAHPQEVQASQDAIHARLLAHGRSPDDVGELVLEAIRHDRLYVFTQDANAAAVEARSAGIVAAMRHDEAYLEALSSKGA